ncbi:MAG: sulfotransferase domain-containing protein, partial [Phycisphaerales bacterium]|nr:sulfotransferase domain-containing protein [Phycisphaerales bacterium]
MKSATSSLHARLAAQPGVFMSTPKEPCFFSDDAVWAKGLGWYASLFENAPAEALCGESSTHYTKLPTFPETIDRARSVVPNARLIYVMRHPVDRLVSQYVHEWTQGNVSVGIDEAVENDETFVRYSSYAEQIMPWLDAYGPGRVLPVFFERLMAEPASELARVARFIGVDGPLVEPVEARRENVSSDRLRKGPLLRLLMETPVVSHIRRALVPTVAREWVKNRFFRMRRRPGLSEPVRAALDRAFDEDLAEL